MQRRKSQRHVNAARARWRAAEMRADAEREAGIPDREPIIDARQPVDLDLRTWGGPHLRIEPRLGYVSGRAIDVQTGKPVDCAALKTLLHRIADRLPRMMAVRELPERITQRDEADATAC